MEETTVISCVWKAVVALDVQSHSEVVRMKGGIKIEVQGLTPR